MRAAFARLLSEPWRFSFDAGVRLLMRLRRRPDPVDAARFRTTPGLAYPAAEITSVRDDIPGKPPEVTVTIGGLTGPSGVLPRFYSEQVVQQSRARAEGLHRFLDMLGQRMVAGFAAAGIKYRPARAAEQAHLGGVDDPHRAVLLALVGDAATPRARPEDERETLLYYAGLFAAWPRSADRLEAMLSEWMGCRITVAQFQGGWLTLPPDQQTRLPAGRDRGRFNRLGHDAAAGARSWDAHGRVLIRIEGLDQASFRGLLPDRSEARRLTGLVRAYLGPAVDFAINPVPRRDQVPLAALGRDTRLGWDSWMVASPRPRDAVEARFPAAVVERTR